jgi:outer membrane protein assembly factor BamB
VDAVYVSVTRTQRAEGCPAGEECEGPYVVAFERATGRLLWATEPIDSQEGADVYGSPVIFEDAMMVGISGGSAELGDEADRYAFQGSMTFLDALTGEVLKKTWTIHPPNQPNDQFAGAGVWSTPAIDREDKVAFAGTANPFKPQAEHNNANAVVKYDVDRSSRRFGEIIGTYKGDIDEYVPGLSQLPCYDFPGNNPPFYPQGLGACGDIDLDFGASSNLFRGPGGRKLVGTGQKSGVYHVFDAKTMEPVWKQVVGPPTALGGIVGSTAHDGQSVYGPITVPGYVWSLSASNGGHRWIGPIGDGAHWGPPVAVANGVMYTVDTAGYLDAYDARTGTPLTRRPLALGGSGPVSLSWGGVTVARNTIYAGVGLASLSEGFIVAFRPGKPEDTVGDIPDTLNNLGGGGGGGAVPTGTAIVAGPGATSTGYLTPVMATRVGGPLSFVNLDPVQHDVVSDERQPDGRATFSSKVSGLGEVAPVQGMDKVKAGQTYGFYCSIHPGMRGQLLVR